MPSCCFPKGKIGMGAILESKINPFLDNFNSNIQYSFCIFWFIGGRIFFICVSYSKKVNFHGLIEHTCCATFTRKCIIIAAVDGDQNR